MARKKEEVLQEQERVQRVRQTLYPRGKSRTRDLIASVKLSDTLETHRKLAERAHTSQTSPSKGRTA